MSSRQNIAIQSVGLAYSGQVAELLLDEKGELLDYSLNYPFFGSRKKPMESIQYGIYALKSKDSIYRGIEPFRFFSSEKAEAFLLELEFSDFRPLSVSKEPIPVVVDAV